MAAVRCKKPVHEYAGGGNSAGILTVVNVSGSVSVKVVNYLRTGGNGATRFRLEDPRRVLLPTVLTCRL